MINIKIERNLIWDNFWPHISSVFVKWILSQQEILLEMTLEEKENIIQNWNNIAVFRVKSNIPTKFYLWFFNLGIIQYLKYELTSDIDFWVRIWPDNIRFFVLPLNLNSEINLELVEITNENDEKYKDLILI